MTNVYITFHFFSQGLRLKATIRIISDKTLFSVSPFFDNLISLILFIQCISRQIKYIPVSNAAHLEEF